MIGFKTTMGFSSMQLEAKQALGISCPINSLPTGLRAGSPMLTSTYETQFSLAKFVEQWKGKEISRWIEGLGDQMYPYLGLIRDTLKSGAQLEAIDDDSLKKMGISALGARKTILQAISLLLYFCYESENENLQRLAHKVKVSCVYIEKTMKSAIRKREKANKRSEIVQILNSVSNAVLQVAEHTKRLVFWLDRTPFDDMDPYIGMRNRLSSMMWNLLRNVNVQPKALFETGQQIITIAKELAEECQIIMENQDPLILYASFVESATLKRPSSEVDWGLNIQSSYRGIHVISEIKEGSPADGCTKVDAGDEILMINGRVVIGWDLTSVAHRLGSGEFADLTMTLKRRPREPQLPKQSKLRATAPTSQTAKKYSTDDPLGRFLPRDDMLPLARHRSCHAISEILKENEIRRRIFRHTLRRSSIASSSPKKEIRKLVDPSNPMYWDIDDDSDSSVDGMEEALVPRIARRTRTMRHQPDGYVRSFIDNKLVCDIEDDVVNDQMTYNVKCPRQYAEIEVVEKEELVKMNITEPKITDEEWSAPYQEFKGHIFPTTSDGQSSGHNLESPRVGPVSSRMATSMDESAFNVLPSPSTSSMNSVYSPAAFGKQPMTSSLTDWTGSSSDDLPGSPGVAIYAGMEKIFEGWVKRRKTRAELSANEVTNKWPKCWMCLRGHYLLLYGNQYMKRPDMAINLVKATISDSTDLKTSKKNIFRIVCPPLDYHFSCLTSLDWRNWIQKMKGSKEMYTNLQQQQQQQKLKQAAAAAASSANEPVTVATDQAHHVGTSTGSSPLSISQSDDPRGVQNATLPRAGQSSSMGTQYPRSGTLNYPKTTK